MNTFALETETMNTTLPETVHKSVEVKQESAQPPFRTFPLFQKKNVCFKCSSIYILPSIGKFISYFGVI